MNEEKIARLCAEVFSQKPRSVARCGVGTGNYVYKVACGDETYIFRCSGENGYSDTIYWLERLAELALPVPKVLGKGCFEGYEYLILSYIEGKDLGLVYRELGETEKREIARQVVEIQNRVAGLVLENIEPGWTWAAFVEDMLNRAEERIARNGYFQVERVDRLRGEMEKLEGYFVGIAPVAYLDDITTKNLLVHEGRLSGIIDVDWIGVGDRLTQPALTYTALRNMDCDTSYAGYILEEMRPNETEKRAFLFYALLYCVDFMGERGTKFMDRTVEATQEIVDRLNNIFDMLWAELQSGQPGIKAIRRRYDRDTQD